MIRGFMANISGEFNYDSNDYKYELKGDKATIKRKSDGKTFNVQSSLLTKGNTVDFFLSKVMPLINYYQIGEKLQTLTVQGAKVEKIYTQEAMKKRKNKPVKTESNLELNISKSENLIKEYLNGKGNEIEKISKENIGQITNYLGQIQGAHTYTVGDKNYDIDQEIVKLQRRYAKRDLLKTFVKIEHTSGILLKKVEKEENESDEVQFSQDLENLDLEEEQELQRPPKLPQNSISKKGVQAQTSLSSKVKDWKGLSRILQSLLQVTQKKQNQSAQQAKEEKSIEEEEVQKQELKGEIIKLVAQKKEELKNALADESLQLSIEKTQELYVLIELPNQEWASALSTLNQEDLLLLLTGLNQLTEPTQADFNHKQSSNETPIPVRMDSNE